MSTLIITIELDGVILAQGERQVNPGDRLPISVLSAGREVISLILNGLREGTRTEARTRGGTLHHYIASATEPQCI